MILYSDPVFLTEVVMLAALLSAGLYLSHTDLSIRMVPNKWTFGLLLIGIVGQVVMISLDVILLKSVVAILLTALAIAFALTLFGFWAPGDAKFFWAAVVALPPTLCPIDDPFSLQATPMALILNALACYLVVLLLVPFWQKQWRFGRSEDEADKPRLLTAAMGLAGLTGLTLGFSVLIMERPLSYLEAFGGVMIGYRLMERLIKVEHWPLFIVPGGVAFLYVGYTSTAWQEYVLLLAIASAAEVVYLCVRRWYSRAYVQLFPLRYLRAGAILRKRLQFTGPNGREVMCEAGRPLTEKQAMGLQSALVGEATLGAATVEVEQAIPFVPVITGAAVITAFFAGNLVPPLVTLVKWLDG